MQPPTLTPFDDAVIAYAQSRGEPSEDVYKRVDSLKGPCARSFFTEQQLLTMLEAVKTQDTDGLGPSHPSCRCGRPATHRDRATGRAFCDLHCPDGNICDPL